MWNHQDEQATSEYISKDETNVKKNWIEILEKCVKSKNSVHWLKSRLDTFKKISEMKE